MSEMVERVARALCRTTISRPDYNPVDVDRNVDEKWPLFADHARAAIAAMRKPTTLMLIAAGRTDSGCELEFHDSEQVWQAMVDEALK